MRRPTMIAGKPIPKGEGRCFHCHALLGPKEGSVELVAGKFRIVCREVNACAVRAAHRWRAS